MSESKSSTGKGRLFTPATAQRFAKWQMQPRSKTVGCFSRILDKTELFRPTITLQLSDTKLMRLCHPIPFDLEKIDTVWQFQYLQIISLCQNMCI